MQQVVQVLMDLHCHQKQQELQVQVTLAMVVVVQVVQHTTLVMVVPALLLLDI
jgi:hypothetical protein